MEVLIHATDPASGGQVSLAGVFACGPDGHQLLISPTGETVRVSLTKDALVRASASGSRSLYMACCQPYLRLALMMVVSRSLCDAPYVQRLFGGPCATLHMFSDFLVFNLRELKHSTVYSRCLKRTRRHTLAAAACSKTSVC